jgi:hypothetical protein
MKFDEAVEEAKIAITKGYEFSILYDPETQECSFHTFHTLKNNNKKEQAMPAMSEAKESN